MVRCFGEAPAWLGRCRQSVTDGMLSVPGAVGGCDNPELIMAGLVQREIWDVLGNRLPSAVGITRTQRDPYRGGRCSLG